MTAQEFLAELERCRREHAAAQSNRGCVEITACRDCVDLVFSQGCVRCFKSSHSVDCTDCYGLAHCVRCRDSHALAYCEDCDHCATSNYLHRSTSCSECDYCFGCVGLVKKEFHILNKPYSRSAYFALVKELKAALAQPIPADGAPPSLLTPDPLPATLPTGQ
jgi:hypothetical protein